MQHAHNEVAAKHARGMKKHEPTTLNMLDVREYIVRGRRVELKKDTGMHNTVTRAQGASTSINHLRGRQVILHSDLKTARHTIPFKT
jgi:hypothetical protein